jgi:glyoxylase-like metal-dependent hydrolase (beta-lactamase superfamily II)
MDAAAAGGSPSQREECDLMTAMSFTVGRIGCEILPDGIGLYRKETIFSDVNEEELARALDGRLNADGWLPVPYNALLVRSGDEVVLIDTGAGAELAAEWGDPVGRLPESMDASGIGPGQVDTVILSHGHPDHIGGLTVESANGRVPAFPHARHLISSEEFDFWTSGRVPEEFASMAALAGTHLIPLRDAGMLELVGGDEEIVPGIRLVAAPGHTPGHIAVSISDGEGTSLYVGDAITTEVSLTHPDWTSKLEIDRAGAAGTRRRLLDRAVADGSIITGFHMAGVGPVEAANGAYRLAALQGS